MRWVYRLLIYIMWLECKLDFQNNVTYTLPTVRLWHIGGCAS
jgi:hypothetical protein